MSDDYGGKGQLWRLGAVELARLIRARAISAREATESALARLDEVNPCINAVVDVMSDEARAAAQAADKAFDAGEPVGPLHGVPVTVKINVDTRGRPTTDGVIAFRDAIAKEDDPAVANWRRAGAVIIGRTNTPCFSCRWFTSNDLHGATRNPRNLKLTPGGSTGGGAAAVAAGIGALAHGNDYGGSIRYPAYACGVVGLRPSFGRIGYCGYGGDEPGLAIQLIAVQGPLARRVRDVRLGFAAMAAKDLRDVWWTPAPLEARDVAWPIRVALFLAEATPEVAAAVRQAGKWLEEAGYRVEEAAPPDYRELAQLWVDIVAYELGPSQPLGRAIEKFGDLAVRNIVRGKMAHAGPMNDRLFIERMAERTGQLRAWNMFLERYPILLMPVSNEPPFVDQGDQMGDEEFGKILAAQRTLNAVGVLGLPGLTVPTSIANDTPLGVQLVSQRFRESLLLDAGEIIEARANVEAPVTPKP